MKHAYLIMAHNNYDLLKELIYQLDDVDNKIFIHIDKKSDITDEEKEGILSVCKNSDIQFTPRTRVSWGGDSQVLCEMNLLKVAIVSDCDYYHFLSGQDFPIKNMHTIKKFFEENEGKEFVSYTYDVDYAERIKYYHLFRNIIGRNKNSALYRISQLFVVLQKKIGFSRIKGDMQVYGGANWCSITKNFAKYLTCNRKKILRTFGKSVCADEVFIQTILKNSPFKGNIFTDQDINYADGLTGDLRAIDWKRGNPYTFDETDFGLLKNCKCLFCRKVSNTELQEKKLIERIKKELL